MNPSDNALDRLLKAASKSREAVPQSIPFPVERRVLASRRQPAATADDWSDLLPFARHGLVLAALIALMTVLLCTNNDDPALPTMDAMVLDSVAEMSFLP